jgi:hypothetical protein
MGSQAGGLLPVSVQSARYESISKLTHSDKCGSHRTIDNSLHASAPDTSRRRRRPSASSTTTTKGIGIIIYTRPKADEASRPAGKCQVEEKWICLRAHCRRSIASAKVSAIALLLLLSSLCVRRLVGLVLVCVLARQRAHLAAHTISAASGQSGGEQTRRDGRRAFGRFWPANELSSE